MCVDLLGSVFFVYKGITILYSVLCRLCCESVVTCKKFHMLRSALVCAVESHSYLLVLGIFVFFSSSSCFVCLSSVGIFQSQRYPILYSIPCAVCVRVKLLFEEVEAENKLFFFNSVSTFICRDTPSCTLCSVLHVFRWSCCPVLYIQFCMCQMKLLSCTLFCPACVQVKLLSWTVSCMRSGEAAVLYAVLHDCV